jgi:hypothetical protein
MECLAMNVDAILRDASTELLMMRMANRQYAPGNREFLAGEEETPNSNKYTPTYKGISICRGV